ncbi:hypothetical protein [Pseudomonas turukhanskensis]|uniref:Uncharacterized protein n=1 Tax=Pseudomonas turukhanskensis TaxID=1806536 RepID=A0A9W6K9E7_9PSED|nr:hypothetical protein [Pseudomonas turukhanskensis]GLK89378.1 hypothetical protein GCM10017655_24400 [Pseudomonas turukhanskensis]
MSTAKYIIGILSGLVVIGQIIWILIALRIGYTKLDVMLSHLKKSSSIIALAPLRHGGVWGKLLLVGGISGVVTFANLYLRFGTVSAEDISNFPAPLKRKLAILQWTVIGLVGAMVILATIIKSGLVK